jgi:hypothetical protein
MAYFPNIPQPGDAKATSQGQILANFQHLNDLVLGINNFILLPEQAAAPATAATQMALYTKHVGADTAMFIRNHTSGAEVDITTAGKTTTGWCVLPCGIIVKWGTSAAVHGTGGGKSINLAVAPAPVINTVLAVTLTATDSDSQAIVSYSGFTPATQTVTWTYGRSFAPGGGTDATCKCIILGI